MKVATSIQERLWELRKDKGLNLEELSKLTGISKSALGSYEKEDYKEINHGNLITLADFYGVSVDYLQDGQGFVMADIPGLIEGLCHELGCVTFFL